MVWDARPGGYEIKLCVVELFIRTNIVEDSELIQIGQYFLKFQDCKKAISAGPEESAKAKLLNGLLGRKAAEYLIAKAIESNPENLYCEKIPKNVRENAKDLFDKHKEDLKIYHNFIFIGDRVFREFLEKNKKVLQFNVHKYGQGNGIYSLSDEQVEETFLDGVFSEETQKNFYEIFMQCYGHKLKVCGSSQLCMPNMHRDFIPSGNKKEDFQRFQEKIKRVYSLYYKKDAIQHRIQTKQLACDEELGIVVAVGEKVNFVIIPNDNEIEFKTSQKPESQIENTKDWEQEEYEFDIPTSPFAKILPPASTVKKLFVQREQLGYYSIDIVKLNPNTGHYLNQLFKEHKDVIDMSIFLGELRHKMYGLAGKVANFSDVASKCAIWEQHVIEAWHFPTQKETEKEYAERQRKWRSLLAINTLAILPVPEIERIWGDITSRVLRKYCSVQSIKEKYFNDGDGTTLYHYIDHNTPTNTLLGILKYIEEHPKSHDLEPVKKATHEQLLRRYVTDDSYLIAQAMKYFRAEDYLNIFQHFPGSLAEGKIGGKSAGMFIADVVLKYKSEEFDKIFFEKWSKKTGIQQDTLKEQVKLENIMKENLFEFIGTEVFAEFIRSTPCLASYSYAKYCKPFPKTDQEILQDFYSAIFPDFVLKALKHTFDHFYPRPIIVRSSSLLEDGIAPFPGQYESIELPNDYMDLRSQWEKEFQDQGKNREEAKLLTEEKIKAKAFEDFQKGIKFVFASTFFQSPLSYREYTSNTTRKESMGCLIMALNGESYGMQKEYFYPQISFVLKSFWPEIFGEADPEDGGLSWALGLGKEVVEGDADVLVFGHRIASMNRQTHKSPQKVLQLINRKTGKQEGISLNEYIQKKAYKQGYENDPFITASLSKKEDEFGLRSLSFLSEEFEPEIDVKVLKQQSNFWLPLCYIAHKIENLLGFAPDIEGTAHISRDKQTGQWKIDTIQMVQCRPTNFTKTLFPPAQMPETVDASRILLSTEEAQEGACKQNIRYLVIVEKDNPKMLQMHTYLNKLNEEESLDKEGYILFVPKRIGTRQADMGVPCHVRDFSKAKAVLEDAPNFPSYGDHFKAELQRAGIGVYAVSQEPKEKRMFKIQNALEKILSQRKEKNCNHLFPYLRQVEECLYVLDLEEIGEQNWNISQARIHIGMRNRRLSPDDETRPGNFWVAAKNQDLPIIYESPTFQ